MAYAGCLIAFDPQGDRVRRALLGGSGQYISRTFIDWIGLFVSSVAFGRYSSNGRGRGHDVLNRMVRAFSHNLL
jgi:hypothetical protein